MIKLQTRDFIETLTYNKANSGNQHNAHIYTDRFKEHLYEESAPSRFEVATTTIYKCNEDRLNYATLNHGIFIQYKEALTLSQAKLLRNLKMFTSVFVTKHLQSNFMLKQTFEMVMLNLKSHRSIENWKGTNFFANKIGFGAVHPNAHIDAKLDYMIS